MKSAAACPLDEALGTPSSQLPIMPMPFPLGPAGIGMQLTLPFTCETVEFSTISVISPGHTVDWYAWPIAMSRERSAASMLSEPGGAAAFRSCTRNLTALRDAALSIVTFQF